MKSAIILLGVLLSACASSPPSISAKPAAVVSTTHAKCETQRQCAEVWLAAQQWVQNLSGMRIRIVTDSRLETFVASGYGRMTGVVTKFQEVDGAHTIRVQFECFHNTPCSDQRVEAINGFNTVLTGVVETSPEARAKRLSAPPAAQTK